MNFVNFSECEQTWCGHNFCPTGPPEACIFLKPIFLFHVFVFLARSSFAPAAVAFAAATAGSSNPRDLPSGVRNNNNTGHLCKRMNYHCNISQKTSSDSFREAARRKMSITSSAATMRVLSVLRHWVTKHGQVRCKLIKDYQGFHPVLSSVRQL